MELNKYSHMKTVGLTITFTLMAMAFLFWLRNVDLGDGRMDAMPSSQGQAPLVVKVMLDQTNLKPVANGSQINTIRSSKTTSDVTWDYNWDKRSDQIQGHSTRTIYLVRHGKYNFETGSLTQYGLEQVTLTARRLTSMANGKFKYSSIHHSSMLRAKESATIIRDLSRNVTMTTEMLEDSMLIEGGPVPPKPTLSYWSLPESKYHVDGPRMESAFRKYFYRAEANQIASSHHVIAAHGNLIRYFILRALQLPPSAWMRLFVAHASVTVVHCNSDGSVNANLIGDSGHLPVHLVTY